MKHILIATPNPKAIEIIRKSFETRDEVKSTTLKDNCFHIFSKSQYDFLFIDIDFLQEQTNENNFKKLLQPFWQVFSECEIIILTGTNKIREAVNLVKAGASNYLTYPLNPPEIKYIIEDINEYTRLQSELNYLRNQFWRKDSFNILRTNCSVMKDVFAKIRAVSETDSSVLLLGETGTGKGVLAKLIHQHSNRGDKQFISIHCGAVPDTLLESELFGYEKGAFTGAVRRKLGKFEIANNGTIFLDEIGTITPSMQIKLLQVLQDRTFHRLGGEVTLTADVRIIAATNVDLIKMCDEGTFRYDLYYRLNVFPIEIPPLRDRIDDIPLLVQLFLKRLNRMSSKTINDIHPEVLDAFKNYNWPGNIRELENLIERAYILENSTILTPKNFPLILFNEKVPKYLYKIDASKPLEEVRRNEIEKIERQYLNELMLHHKGKIKTAAESAGIGVRQLHKLLTKYNIHKENFK